MAKYGLIGYPLKHSFSPSFFAEKFKKEKIDASYQLFPLENIKELPELLEQVPNLKGLNVTIPYKESVIPFLDELSPEASEVGAVNTIKISKALNRTWLTGYNTDVFGFQKSIVAFLGTHHQIKALILGTGGAAKAVARALKKLQIEYKTVSRSSSSGNITYSDLDQNVINKYQLIINTTPLGMHPSTDKAPTIPYQNISSRHFCYDLIYNPEKTTFLEKAEARGAAVKNGYDMLRLQAQKSWELWNR